MYTVVLKFHTGKHVIESETKFVDSSTRAGASRKANTYLKDMYFLPVKKTRLDNYEYWTCKDALEK